MLTFYGFFQFECPQLLFVKTEAILELCRACQPLEPACGVKSFFFHNSVTCAWYAHAVIPNPLEVFELIRIQKHLLTTALACSAAVATAAQAPTSTSAVKHVLLISIDGMHAVDFINCATGLSQVNGGAPYCPSLAALSTTGVNYLQAFTTKPSDSFPGSVGLVTGAAPRTSGFFYDVSYDRALSPPTKTTSVGIVGAPGLCPGTVGTQVGFDESIDKDLTKLNGGGGIDPDYLPRDPKNGCAPVYPHNFLRVNTVFEVVKGAGGYTAWSDKHPAYDFYNGPSGTGVSDFYSPEINSVVVPLPGIPGCAPIADPGADLSSWTNSFANVRCYDTIKVNTVLNWIHGKTHDGVTSAPVPNVFGMNFQAVSVGQKLVENNVTGGYVGPHGWPTPSLLQQIQFVDTSIGKMVAELKNEGLWSSTVVIITAKHGQSPIDPHRLQRTGDDPSKTRPSTLLGSLVAGISEDDISLLWLADQKQLPTAVTELVNNEVAINAGQILFGHQLDLMFNDPATDSRTPDIVVVPNPGTIYTGSHKKVSEHGGFTQDDTNVMLLVSSPALTQRTYTLPVQTIQVAPSILQVLGLDPAKLEAVQKDGTKVLPDLAPVAN